MSDTKSLETWKAVSTAEDLANSDVDWAVVGQYTAAVVVAFRNTFVSLGQVASDTAQRMQDINYGMRDALATNNRFRRMRERYLRRRRQTRATFHGR